VKIVVNRALCDGNGLCADAAPELLTMDDNDELEIVQPSFNSALLDKARAAVATCPKAALSIVEE